MRALLPELGRAFTTLFEEGAEDGRALNDVIERLGGTLIDAFEGAIERGESLIDVLKGLALDLARLLAQRGGDARRGTPALAPPAPASARPPALAMAA